MIVKNMTKGIHTRSSFTADMLNLKSIITCTCFKKHCCGRKDEGEIEIDQYFILCRESNWARRDVGIAFVCLACVYLLFTGRIKIIRVEKNC